MNKTLPFLVRVEYIPSVLEAPARMVLSRYQGKSFLERCILPVVPETVSYGLKQIIEDFRANGSGEPDPEVA